MIDVAATVELEGALKSDDGRNVILGRRLGQFLLRSVEVVHVGLERNQLPISIEGNL